MVTRYDVISSRWSSHFLSENGCFSTSFRNKSKACDKMMQSNYLCVILHVKRKKLLIPTVFAWFLILVIKQLRYYARSDWPSGCKQSKHGCGVKMFRFSRANHASTDLKKFSSSKLGKFSLFTHSFAGWNLENRYKQGLSIFLVLIKLTF